jgi:hypothetical protein
VFNLQTLIHNYNQPSLACRLRRLLIKNAHLHPNHKRPTKLGFNLYGLFNNRQNVLRLPENVDDIDGFLDFNRNIKKALVAFLAQYFVGEGVDGYDAVAVLL